MITQGAVLEAYHDKFVAALQISPQGTADTGATFARCNNYLARLGY